MQRTGSIMIVDNELTIGALIAEILTDEGYVAYAAPNSADALASIACYLPALLLLDPGRPGSGSAELIAQLRSADLAAVPMVVMTTAPEETAPLLVSQSVECLVKPFDIGDLLACVARYVQPAPGSRSAIGALQ